MGNSASCWVAPDGAVHPLGGKGHSEFAYDILLNEKLGEHMAKKPVIDGTGDQKGKSGEHAKAEATKELGSDPCDPKHSEALRNKGWIQASSSGAKLLVIAVSIDVCRSAWCQISAIGSSFPSVVLAIGRSGSGVTAGLSGKDLTLPADLVMARIAEAASIGANAKAWPQHHGVKYFE